MKARVKPKNGDEFEQAPKLFDAKQNELDRKKVSVWGGSKMKVNFEVVPYMAAATKSAGITLRLRAVQVIELVSGGGGNAESYGFGEEEGYANEAPFSDASDETTGGAGADDASGDF